MLTDPSRRSFLQASLGLAAAASLAAPSLMARPLRTNVRILILGAGAGGLSIASRLARQLEGASISLVGARQNHYYQPGYTMIASGLWRPGKVVSQTQDWLPRGVDWINQDALSLDPDAQQVGLANGQLLSYDLLIVATGCQLNYQDLEGMSPELIGQHGIGSVYASPEAAAITSQMIDDYRDQGGRAIFTLTHTPLKCAGAPIKMTFTTLSRLEATGQRQRYQVDFFSPNDNRVFGVPFYNDFVLQRFAEQQVGMFHQHRLTGIDAPSKTAYFRTSDGSTSSQSYDFIHVVPPMSAPDLIRQSPLAWQQGGMAGQWLEVDQYSLQHLRYPNVFGIGDVNGIPFGKTAASVKLQVPTVEQNILAYLQQQELPAKYNGYTSCPLITGIGKAMLAEFGYGAELLPSFSFIDPKEESWAVWIMKEKMLQPAYYAMLRGHI